MTTQTKPHDRLTAAERHELPDSAFGIPETREFPLVDAEHVRAAEAYFRYAPDTEKAALARRILAKAAEFGVHVQSPTIRIWAEKPCPARPEPPPGPANPPNPPPPSKRPEAAAGVFLPPLHATIIPGTGTRLHLPGSGTFGHVPAGSPSSRPREAKGAGLPCTVIFRRS